MEKLTESEIIDENSSFTERRTRETDGVVIRNAALSDAERLIDIYGFYVRNTAISFEYDVPSLEEFRGRIGNTIKKYQVFLPGESQGQGSLVGCCLWRRTESDMTEAT